MLSFLRRLLLRHPTLVRNDDAMILVPTPLVPSSGEPEPVPSASTCARGATANRYPLFIDVETTGLHSEDRIVSIGLILLDMNTIALPAISCEAMHLIFDPCRKSHPMAEAVHGYDDWLLRHQELFLQHVEAIMELLRRADLLVAHNAAFDARFLARELEIAGHALPSLPVVCTMQEAKADGHRAALTACCERLGLARSASRHDAAEDAWMTMMLYLNRRAPAALARMKPRPVPIQNLLPVPARPVGPLPRRKNKQKLAGCTATVAPRRRAIRSSPPV